MTPPPRHWRSYGNDTLPTPAEALDQPFSVFPSWFLRIECDRCGKVQMVNEAHARWHDRTLRATLAQGHSFDSSSIYAAPRRARRSVRALWRR